MNITLLGGGDNERRGGFRDRSPRGRRGGDRNGGGNRRDGNRGGNRNRDGGNRGGGRPKKEEITQEQLDAEMDDYLNKREVA